MQQAMKRGDLKGVRASRRGLRILHLLFADDSILFGEASIKNVVFLEVIVGVREMLSAMC